MTQMIQIRPTPALRRPFAEWAVGQRPKIRTVSTFEFAVPAHLFVDVPESVLIGALVDGHRYVSPEEDAAANRPAPGAQPRLLACGHCYEEDGQEVHPHPECTTGVELLGVATQEGLTPVLVGDVGPETVIPFDGAREAVFGDTLPEVPASAYPRGSVPLESAGPHACDRCDRAFTTERGRDLHVRAKHSEVTGDGS